VKTIGESAVGETVKNDVAGRLPLRKELMVTLIYLRSYRFSCSIKMSDIIRYAKPAKPSEPIPFPEEYNQTIYFKWLKSVHKPLSVKTLYTLEDEYSKTQKDICCGFKNSDFWKELCANLATYEAEYKRPVLFAPVELRKEREQNGLLDPREPELLPKPWDSFLDKTYRKNKKINDSREGADKNWLLPYNWYQKINDIVRTSFVVKYFDGVEFLTLKIYELCHDMGLCEKPDCLGRMDGYYAAHIIVKHEFEVSAETFGTEVNDFNLEIQIRTQIQDLVQNLLHTYYKKNRTKSERKQHWEWNYADEEFAANYLGHIVHYVDGKIVDLMDIINKKEEKL